MVTAFTRLNQKGIIMEIEIHPIRITFDHHEQKFPLRFKIKIVRGTVTWESNVYTVNDDSMQYLDFEDEHFKKDSTKIYFTDKGAEFKKAVIKVIRISPNDKESEMCS